MRSLKLLTSEVFPRLRARIGSSGVTPVAAE
jgi:hypothetical protein